MMLNYSTCIYLARINGYLNGHQWRMMVFRTRWCSSNIYSTR